nr:MAG TPA: hypothetical protein [Caudoviricetes sp.]
MSDYTSPRKYEMEEKKMAMFKESCECEEVGVEQKPKTVFSLLGESYDLTTKALAMATQINATIFGKQAKERKQENPRCTRDAIVRHVDDLKVLYEELSDILSGLGM